MFRQKIHRISAVVPIALSLLAFTLVLAAVATGKAEMPDEGSAAHIFQLLIALQLPFITAFLVTADWKQSARIGATLCVQVGAMGLAFAPVAFFNL